MNQMTGTERAKAAIRFEEPDYVPLFLSSFGLEILETSPEIGSLHDVLKNKDIMVMYGMSVVETSDTDCIWLPFSVYEDADSLGLRVQWGKGGTATSGIHIWPDNYIAGTGFNLGTDDLAEKMKYIFEQLEPTFDSFMENPIQKSKIQTLEEYSERFPNHHVVCATMDNMSLWGEMMGVEAATSVVKYHLPLVLELQAKYLTQVCREQGKAMWEAGADGVFSGASIEACAINDPQTRDYYADNFFFPSFREHTRALREIGITELWSHCCQNGVYFMDRMKDWADCGYDVLFVADPIDYGALKGVVGTSAALMGGPTPSQFLWGDPIEIRRAVKYTIGRVAPGGGLILSCSDGLPAWCPKENLDMFFKAGRKYGKYPIQNELAWTAPWDL
jgi:uroporphyrinogen-III decarboxylase